jgi:AcrR family transcriptional regulator
MHQDDTRSKILKACVGLMLETGDINQVTFRGLADRAGVGLGAINYHFRDKETLTALAVNAFLADVVATWRRQSFAGDDRRIWLQTALEGLCDFITAHPRIIRISILFEMQNPAPDDVSSQITAHLANLLGSTDRAEATTKAQAITSAIQCRFLRSKENDAFFDNAKRSGWIRDLARLLA